MRVVHWWRFVGLVVLAALVFTQSSPVPVLYAQEEEVTEEAIAEPLPTETPLPSETPTDIPTATFTETATSTLTETPMEVVITETATETPSMTPAEDTTATASAVPTAETVLPTETATLSDTSPTASPETTATLTPSATQEVLPSEPPLTPIFTDNFDSGPSILWTLGSGWSYVPNGNGLALQGTISGEPVTFANNNVLDAAVEARFQINAGAAQISTRVSEAGRYTASLDISGQVSLYRSDVLLGTTTIVPLVAGDWHTLRLSAFDDVIRVSVNGVEVIAVRDTQPLPAGTVAITAIISEKTTLSLDDFVLEIFQQVEVPAVTLTPSPTLEQVTGMSQSLRSDFSLIYSHSFNGVMDPFYELYTSGLLGIVPNGPDFALAVSTNNQTVQITPANIENVIVQVRVLLTSGIAQLGIRQNDANEGFTASLAPNGTVALYRANLLLKTATVEAFNPNQWHILEVVGIEDHITIAVDGNIIIDVVDNSWTTQGGVYVIAQNLNGGQLLIDDIHLWSEDLQASNLRSPSSLPSGVVAPNSLVSAPAFFINDDAMGYNLDITTLNIVSSTTSQIQLDLPTDATSGLALEWSPDANRIAFTCSLPGVASAICVANSDGSNVTQVTSATGYYSSPRWSPNGEEIAFTLSGTTRQIWKLEVDNPTNIELLTTIIGGHTASGIDWAPDNYIYFHSWETLSGFNAGIHKISGQDGTGFQLVLLDDDVNAFFPNSFVYAAANPSVNSAGDIAFDIYLSGQKGVGRLQTDDNIVIIQEECAQFAEYRPEFSFPNEIAFKGPRYLNCDNEDLVSVRRDDGQGDIIDLPIDAGPGPFDWFLVLQVQATATPNDATATAQALSLTATALAALTPTPTPTPTPSPTPLPDNCEAPSSPTSGQHFIANGGLIRHEGQTVLPFGSGHTITRHVAKTDGEMKNMLGTGRSKTSTFLDLGFATGLTAETLDQNHALIVAWSGIAEQGDQLNDFIGTGILGSGFTPSLYDFFGNTGRGWKIPRGDQGGRPVPFDPTTVRVILRCNYQNPAGIPYTIISAFPDE